MENLKITAPEGYEIDREKSTLDEIVFKPVKKALPKSWEELESVSGWFNSPQGNVLNLKNLSTMAMSHKDTFVTKEQAAASIALAQLSQLREVYRDGWEPNWRDRFHSKWCIEFYENELVVNGYERHCAFLSFQNKETAEDFLNNFRKIIEEARPLFS